MSSFPLDPARPASDRANVVGGRGFEPLTPSVSGKFTYVARRTVAGPKRGVTCETHRMISRCSSTVFDFSRTSRRSGRGCTLTGLSSASVPDAQGVLTPRPAVRRPGPAFGRVSSFLGSGVNAESGFWAHAVTVLRARFRYRPYLFRSGTRHLLELVLYPCVRVALCREVRPVRGFAAAMPSPDCLVAEPQLHHAAPKPLCFRRDINLLVVPHSVDSGHALRMNQMMRTTRRMTTRTPTPIYMRHRYPTAHRSNTATGAVSSFKARWAVADQHGSRNLALDSRPRPVA